MAESRPDVMPIVPLWRGAAAQDERDPLDDDDLDDDPVIAAYVERAVAPYRGVLPPDELLELEELLGDLLATHPAVAPVVERLRKRSPPSESGGRPKRGGRGQ